MKKKVVVSLVMSLLFVSLIAVAILMHTSTVIALLSDTCVVEVRALLWTVFGVSSLALVGSIFFMLITISIFFESHQEE